MIITVLLFSFHTIIMIFKHNQQIFVWNPTRYNTSTKGIETPFVPQKISSAKLINPCKAQGTHLYFVTFFGTLDVCLGTLSTQFLIGYISIFNTVSNNRAWKHPISPSPHMRDCNFYCKQGKQIKINHNCFKMDTTMIYGPLRNYTGKIQS